MPNMNVTYQDMHDAASRLNQGEDDIKSALAQLKSLIDSLVSGGYVTDKSSVAFNNSYQEFNNGATQTISGLSGMASYLNAAANALEQTDSDLANSLNH
jgi:WXG100 family type VII secretion target